MAYRCKENQSRECDGCGSCNTNSQPETGVIVTATIELKFRAYGRIEEELRSGNTDIATKIAEYMVDDTIECCGIAGEDMSVEEVEIELGD